MATAHTLEVNVIYLSESEIDRLTKRQEVWFNRLLEAIAQHDQIGESMASARIRLIKSRLEIDVQSKMISAAVRRLAEARSLAAEVQDELDAL